MAQKRKMLIIRRRIIIALLVMLFAVLVALITVIAAITKYNLSIDKNTPPDTSVTSSVSDISASVSDVPFENQNSQPEMVTTPTGIELDANFGRLLLVNAEYPLPDDYDTNVRDAVVEIDKQYRMNDYATQIHKDVYPYIIAMVAAAQKDGVNLSVLSPFRSYARQSVLFQNKVDALGGDEVTAATVVARPGTSEHNTGLCADFNTVEEIFETTPMFDWLCENAEDYGFILRYPENKQDITGVIYEPWHWRFVGINNAKEINDLGVTLEEFIELKDLDPKIDMYGDD